MAVVGNIVYFYSRSESYFEFSNFSSRAFELDGKWWKTVEHYFQAKKVLDEDQQEMIRLAGTPALAKSLGLKVKLRPDWEEVKEDYMYRALKAKFTQHPSLKRMLLTTGGYELKEKSPRDMYWGYLGKNRLGVLLMRLRDEFGGEK